MLFCLQAKSDTATHAKGKPMAAKATAAAATGIYLLRMASHLGGISYLLLHLWELTVETQ